MMSHSNLESFLSCTTPRVRFHVMPKEGRKVPSTIARNETWCRNFNPNWKLQEKDSIEYFNLGDLWGCYDEWSAYGAGSPIKYGGENVVQYYTPYISALQIFMSKDYHHSSSCAREDCDGDFEDRSWCSESDCEKLSRSSSNNSDKTWDVEDYSNGIDGSHSPGRCRLGDLYFEYFESDVPFGRVPLREKIDALSGKFPGLKTFNSVDLSPASWMAVAWYPIYHIPSSRHAREFYASFLTYHTLSSLFQDDVSCCEGSEIYYDEVGKDQLESKERCNGIISLHPFGLATYRMQSKVWLNPKKLDHERFSTLVCAANSWLKQLHVQHHDYNFFISHPM